MNIPEQKNPLPEEPCERKIAIDRKNISRVIRKTLRTMFILSCTACTAGALLCGIAPYESGCAIAGTGIIKAGLAGIIISEILTIIYKGLRKLVRHVKEKKKETETSP